MAGERLPVRGLVERIGGEDRLMDLLRSFYRRMESDPMVGFFFAGRNLEEIIRGQHAFIMRATGARQSFAGTHPSMAHRALAPILRGHFNRRLTLLAEVLDGEGVAPGDRDAWLRLESGFRGVVQTSRPEPDEGSGSV